MDSNWNGITTNDTVAITSSDTRATLPANAALSGGTLTLSVTFKTTGTKTATASDVTHAGITADTGSGVVVNKGDQTITFGAIADQLTTNTVHLSATATSELPVTFAVTSGPASISGGTNLTFSAAGSVRLASRRHQLERGTRCQPLVQREQPARAVVAHIGALAACRCEGARDEPAGHRP